MLANDFWALMFWQFWNTFLIFKYAFLHYIHTDTHIYAGHLLISAVTANSKDKTCQVLKHNRTWGEKEEKIETAVKGRLWQSNWDTCLASGRWARLWEEAGRNLERDYNRRTKLILCPTLLEQHKWLCVTEKLIWLLKHTSVPEFFSSIITASLPPKKFCQKQVIFLFSEYRKARPG